VLDVRPIHISPREREIRFNGLKCVIGIANNQPSNHVHAISVEIIDRAHRGVVGVTIPVLSNSILGSSAQELKITSQDIFDS
jgi:hypothetical protein